MKLIDAKRIHCIAIGGIGVSALAKLLKKNGVIVTGSDLVASDITDALEQHYGIQVSLGSHPEHITSDIDMVIYSPAVPETDREYQAAITQSIQIMSYPEALGELSHMKTTIAISGTNGKTTTTSMVLECLESLSIHPSVIIGGILQKYKSNFVYGDSEYFITEACEYKRSFLNIHHDIMVITNITLDHLDYFKDMTDIQSAFIEFLNNKKESGVLVCNTQLQNLQPIIEKATEKGFTIIPYEKYLIPEYSLPIPGEHNRENMAAALGVIEALGKDTDTCAAYLKNHFMGTKRRMEYIGETRHGALLYDDYAHNPEGIALLLAGLRAHYPDKKIITLFEPHLYSRTEDFKAEFGNVLSHSDILYLFPVYKAREPHQPEKDFLLDPYITMNQGVYYKVTQPESFKMDFESKQYDNQYIVVTVGAGDIWQHGIDIKK